MWYYILCNIMLSRCEMPHVIFSFFSGAGLLDLGFEEEKYNIVLVNEFQPEFMQAYKYARQQHNMLTPKYGYYECSIENFLEGDLLEQLKKRITQEKDDKNLVGIIGGPPCPDFSVGGKNRGRNGDNGRLAKSYIDLLRIVSPDFFIFENVKGLVKTTKHREYYNELKKQIQENFVISDTILNALCFGVPQDRERVILLGINKKLLSNSTIIANYDLGIDWMKYATFPDVKIVKNLLWPKIDEFRIDSANCINEKIPVEYRQLTVEEWFKKNDVEHHPNSIDVFKVKNGKQKIESIGEGDVSRKSFKRLHRWRYSPTAAYGNNEVHLHPYKARRLSVAEAMAIQSLPYWFCLPPQIPKTYKFKMIGNGVPVAMARGIAKILNELLEKINDNHGDY